MALDFQDAIAGAGGETLLLHGALEQAFGHPGQARSERETVGWTSGRWKRPCPRTS